jgi:hypothetical protein
MSGMSPHVEHVRQLWSGHPTQLVSGVVSEVELYAHQAASSKTPGICKYAFSSEGEHAKAERLIRGNVTYGSCEQGYSTGREGFGTATN